jgi:hypothetical protein
MKGYNYMYSVLRSLELVEREVNLKLGVRMFKHEYACPKSIEFEYVIELGCRVDVYLLFSCCNCRLPSIQRRAQCRA